MLKFTGIKRKNNRAKKGLILVLKTRNKAKEEQIIKKLSTKSLEIFIYYKK